MNKEFKNAVEKLSKFGERAKNHEDHIDVYIKMKSETPLRALKVIADAPGRYSAECMLSDAEFSDESVALPLSVYVDRLEDFCEYVQKNVPGFLAFDLDAVDRDYKPGIVEAARVVVNHFTPA